MNERKQKLEAVFHEAGEFASAAERERFLASACAGDPELRREVDELLNALPAADALFQAGVAACRTLGVAPPPAPTEKPGDVIGRYKLLEKIGEGGMGVVYMAEQTEPVVRKVALKIIKLGMDTRAVVARFEVERQALALMDHPNIARVLDAGATDTGRPYFVMELVHGVPITEYCDKHKLSIRERLQLSIPVCLAIQHAHQKGIIHRDIKPSNVMVTLHDGVPVPKVIDFGIAKATSDQRLTDKTLFTALLQFLGTPAYMSPEQAQLSELDVDTRSDIYSLGVLLYELLTGCTPFDQKELLAAGLDEMRRTIREVEPVKPSTRLTQDLVAADVRRLKSTSEIRDPKTEEKVRGSSRRLLQEVRGDLDWIVMKCLEKDRARRYETANGLAMDLQRHLNNEPVVACPPSVGYRLQKFVQRNRVAVAVASGFLLLLTAAVVVSTALAVWAKAKERQARESEADAKAVMQFFQDRVLAAARPQGQEGGLGHDATIRAAVDAAGPLIAAAFTNRPLVEAAIREVLGTTYHHLGEAERAAAQHQRALELRRPVRGLEHLDTLSAMVWLAEDLRLAGRPAEAIPLLEQALKVGDKLWGTTHTNTFCVMNNLGLSYFEVGRSKESIALLEKTRNLRVEHLGLPHPDTVVSLVNLGEKYRAVGRGADAVPLLEQAVEIARTNLSPHHPNTLTMMNNLALAYSAVGNFPRAAELQQEVLEQRRKLLPPDHPSLLASSNNVALAWRDMGRFPAALALLEQTAQHSREVYGTNGDTITLFNNVALVAEDAGDTNRALPLFKETFNQRRTLLGPDHPATLRAMNFWARALMRSDQLDQAETPLREAEQRWRTTDSNNIATAAATLANLAHCLLLKGDAAGAEARAREYAALAEASSPHPWSKAEASSLLGAALLGQGQLRAAETNLLTAFDQLQANYTRVPAHTGPRLCRSLAGWIRQLQEALQPGDAAEPWRERLQTLEQMNRP